MQPLIRPFLPACVAFALLTGVSPSLADRIDHGGVIELTGADRPDIPSLAEFRCYETAAGVLYTRSAESAAEMVRAINDGAANFQRRFDAKPNAVAVVDSGVISRNTGSEIRASGFDSFLPFTYTSPATNGLVMPKDRALSAMMHELGHIIFISTIWGRDGGEGAEGDSPRTCGPGVHYGGGAPDWLDEVAAMIVQGANLGDGHRDNFARALQDPKRRDAALDLPKLFTSPHPIAGTDAVQRRIEEIRDQIRRGELEGGSRMIMLSPEEAGASELTPFEALYYPICLVFADYILETANDPAVFRRIADALKAGATFDEFLREHGNELGLPAGEAALVDAWRDWALVQHDET